MPPFQGYITTLQGLQESKGGEEVIVWEISGQAGIFPGCIGGRLSQRVVFQVVWLEILEGTALLNFVQRSSPSLCIFVQSWSFTLFINLICV